jgi:hypothetical protein
VRPRTGPAYFLQQIERLLAARPVGFGGDDAEKAAEKMKREACLSELMNSLLEKSNSASGTVAR